MFATAVVVHFIGPPVTVTGSSTDVYILCTTLCSWFVHGFSVVFGTPTYDHPAYA
jgi:hypothetical protein